MYAYMNHPSDFRIIAPTLSGSLKASLTGLANGVSSIFLSFVHAFRIPLIGSDLSKFYLYNSMRCFQISAACVIYQMNEAFGGYLMEDALSNLSQYAKFHDKILVF